MKKKTARKHTHTHTHIRKVSDKKSNWKTSTWTFSIITVGLALLILALIISVKQNLQVLGTQTSVPYNSSVSK